MGGLGVWGGWAGGVHVPGRMRREPEGALLIRGLWMWAQCRTGETGFVFWSSRLYKSPTNRALPALKP